MQNILLRSFKLRLRNIFKERKYLIYKENFYLRNIKIKIKNKK
jgi:hypothetical protein